MGIVRFLGSSHVSHVPFLALYHTRAFPSSRGGKTGGDREKDNEEEDEERRKERETKRGTEPPFSRQ